MLSGNPNRLHLPVTPHQPTYLFPQNDITNLLGTILLLGSHAEKCLLMFYDKVHHMVPNNCC